MKKILVILLILSLGVVILAQSGTVADAERMAREHARADVRVLGTVILGMVFPILTPVVTLFKSFDPPADRLAIAMAFDEPNITSHYISTYKRVRKATALTWGIIGSLLDLLLGVVMGSSY